MHACVCACMRACVHACDNLFCHIRILNLYAEENAIDDATYFLGEALRREAITLDVFLKVINILCCIICYQLS